jgi:hypothetical protein
MWENWLLKLWKAAFPPVVLPDMAIAGRLVVQLRAGWWYSIWEGQRHSLLGELVRTEEFETRPSGVTRTNQEAVEVNEDLEEKRP